MPGEAMWMWMWMCMAYSCHLDFVPCGEHLFVGITPSLFVYFCCCYGACLISLLCAFYKSLLQPIVSAFVPLFTRWGR